MTDNIAIAIAIGGVLFGLISLGYSMARLSIARDYHRAAEAIINDYYTRQDGYEPGPEDQELVDQLDELTTTVQQQLATMQALQNTNRYLRHRNEQLGKENALLQAQVPPFPG